MFDEWLNRRRKTIDQRRNNSYRISGVITMALYPNSIKRCQHIKVNGVQCGSPSLREAHFCYYHIRYHWPELEKMERRQDWYHSFPTLEDANSIRVTLAHVMEQIIDQAIEPKTASLLLYALQTAAINLKQTS